ncbi:ABC transporter permease [Dysgonomonas sp. ZJ709]|uniref:ABC transporter permease n=1 Tax=Dysgonomonas sp. ZJ709 TaxID=2709797 RepID=UPI0013EA3B0B|nr:ABC transporter permease [Dysgonomonas sp. ZJ709]
MNILRSFKRTRFFLWVNIIGLAIGLAVAIMLILFVVNELSYDKHFANSERIIRLNTVREGVSGKNYNPINLRTAYTELPEKIPGIESAVQILAMGKVEVIRNTERYQDVDLLSADPDFFKVFQMKFIEGTPQTAFSNINSIVITRQQADAMFGGASKAMGNTLLVREVEYTVSAVVEKLPVNTHFSFDILANMQSLDYIKYYTGLEFYTYYLIKSDVSMSDVVASIEKEYTSIMKPWVANFNGSEKGYGVTEKLTDIYLHSKATYSIGKSSDMTSIWLLSALALFILLLAVINFINLFIAQGETRMNEVAIRKANGATMIDIVRQFFSEVSLIVFIAFIGGLFLAMILAPYFSKLINKDIDLIQLMNPIFILCIIGLFVMTVILSASYPSFYLSRFSPLDILGKRLTFSKRRLTVVLVVFQSAVTIILISYILVINKQATYLENIPLGYNPKNVLVVSANESIGKSYEALKQELLTIPDVKTVACGRHLIGSGWSGQIVGLFENKEETHPINEYRISSGLSELIEFQLTEGEFFKENTPDSIRQIILNEAAVDMLGLQYPVVGKVVDYSGSIEIVGVVKNFYYAKPSDKIEPLALRRVEIPSRIYIKFDENVSRTKALEMVLGAFRKFDSGFVINPTWSEDVYTQKFDSIKTQSRIVLISSILSIFIAMLGLVAIHLYTTMRRTKEIGIRRVNGATHSEVFVLLSRDIVKWIIIAGVVAIPVVYYISSNWLNDFANRTSLDWTVFVFPLLIQCLIAILVTSGVSLKVLSQNPVDALKTE